VDNELYRILAESGGLMLDIFAPFIEPLERELGEARSCAWAGARHGGLRGLPPPHQRDELRADARRRHQHGFRRRRDHPRRRVARGKTPTCVYLALHYGICAANYPLTEEDLEADRLPAKLRPHRHKLFGLTIDPNRLHQIRQERRPEFALRAVRHVQARSAAGRAHLPQRRLTTLSTTHTSIEEIASKVLTTLGIHREMF
jgi:regulator of PEP synthase PpsR (kinase-PPPase family)